MNKIKFKIHSDFDEEEEFVSRSTLYDKNSTFVKPLFRKDKTSGNHGLSDKRQKTSHSSDTQKRITTEIVTPLELPDGTFFDDAKTSSTVVNQQDFSRLICSMASCHNEVKSETMKIDATEDTKSYSHVLDPVMAKAARAHSPLPYGDDPAKQQRYIAFLDSLGSESADFVEFTEFFKVAQMFQPLRGEMARRFVSAQNVEFDTNSLADLSNAQIAGVRGEYGPATKKVTRFEPVELLCQLFGVDCIGLDDSPQDLEKKTSSHVNANNKVN